MKLADFHFDLPDDLIARRPAAARTGSRLLELDGRDGSLHHRGFEQLPGLLRRGDLLVFNDTRVIPARLFGCKTASGGGVEMLIERVLDGGCVLAQMRASKPPRAGSEISLLDDEGREHVRVRVLGRDDGMYRIAFPPEAAPLDVMRAIGHMPLPPYIDRADEAGDQERYQTVYAAKDGAVAAPTAGLHFDAALLKALAEQGVESGFLTLHVGAGTFQPVRVTNVEEHRMHGEFIAVDRALCAQVNRAHAEGRRVIAVGTTSLRGLESAATAQGLQPCEGETRLFIYPGYRFRSVDALITNFHLPESTLLLLVCAFAGRDHVLEAYRAAIAARYRFYSYGDAMFIHAARQPRLKAERVEA